jgi:hypothetical protein
MRFARPSARHTACSFVLSCLVAAACGGSPTPIGSQVPASGSPAADPDSCRLLGPLRAGLEDLTAAVEAARTGNETDVIAAASRAVERGEAMGAQLATMAPRPSSDRSLRLLIVSGSLWLTQYGRYLAEPTASLLEKIQTIDESFTLAQQTLGSAEAMAAAGACPGFSLPASPLPTLAPMPTPSDGPAPPGRTDEQAAAALASLGLRPAAGIELRVEPRIRWLPKGSVILRDLRLTNSTGATVSYPFDLTVLRWDGGRWTREACALDWPDEPSIGLCGVGLTNAAQLPPGTFSSEDPGSSIGFSWPGTAEIAPGTYALVLPIWRTADEWPRSTPTEAAVAIVTITSSP